MRFLQRGDSNGFGEKLTIFLFFFSDIGKENVFYHILEQTKAFLDYKNNKSKRRKIKIYIFPKGLTHGFGPKMAMFPTFFF